MSKFAWKQALLVVGDTNLTDDTSATSLQLVQDVQEVTAFGSGGTREYVTGLKGADFSHEGFWDSEVTGESVADRLTAASGSAPTTLAIGPAVGSRSYTGRTFHASYAEQANIGEAYSYSADGQVTGIVARGHILHAPATEVTATGDGTAVQTGAVADGATLYSALHVLEISGGTSPTLDVTVDSDDAEGFASGVTRITHPQQTEAGSDWQSQAGPITDDWYRVSYTITGSPTAVRFVVAIGIATD